MKRIISFVFCLMTLILLLGIFGTTPISADSPSGDFACVYSATAIDNRYAKFGSTSVTELTAGEATAQGVPAGYSGDVLTVKNSASSMDVMLDFSDLQIPTACIDTLTFRVCVGDDGLASDAYPEVRIKTPGKEAWIMRYYVGDRPNQWVDITLDRVGGNFQSGYSFESLSSDGVLGTFALTMRCNVANVAFYIDSISYTLVEDNEAPEIRYNGEDTLYLFEGAQFALDVTAYDALQGEVPVSFTWSDPNATNADGTLNKGSYTLTLRARDYQGNETSRTLAVTVGDIDKVPPVIHMNVEEMYLVTGTKPLLHPQVTDNSGMVRSSSFWSEDALDPYGNLTAGIHLFTVKAEDLSGNRAVKKIVVYVADEEYLGDHVIDEQNPPTPEQDSGDSDVDAPPSDGSDGTGDADAPSDGETPPDDGTEAPNTPDDGQTPPDDGAEAPNTPDDGQTPPEEDEENGAEATSNDNGYDFLVGIIVGLSVGALVTAAAFVVVIMKKKKA